MSSFNACLHIPIDVTTNDTAAEGAVQLVGGDTLLEGRVDNKMRKDSHTKYSIQRDKWKG